MWNFKSSLFWYKMLFMVQLLFAEMLFTLNLEHKKGFVWRLLVGVIVCLGVAFVLPIYYNAYYCAFMFFVMFAVSIVALKLIFDESLKSLFFCAIIAYTIQHISSELYELFNVIANINGEIVSGVYGSEAIDLSNINWFIVTVYLWIYGMTYWLSHLLVGKKISKSGVEKLSNSTIFIFGCLIILIDIALSSFITYNIPSDTSRLAVSLLHVYNILCCVMAIALFFILPNYLSLENEFNIVRQINYRQKKQYEVSAENIDLINFRYHDLKHQIRLLGEGHSVDIETLKEIENLIEDYDAACNTGNKALDVILTEKSLICRKFGIRFVCIADGEKIGFIKDADIYSLFGNMMDNAIEAVKEFSEGERTISLNIRAVQNFLIVSLRNRYQGKLVFKDELPETTKNASKGIHGFGMKSMRYTVRKYNGEMTVVANDGIFNLNMVFPLEKT